MARLELELEDGWYGDLVSLTELQEASVLTL